MSMRNACAGGVAESNAGGVAVVAE